MKAFFIVFSLLSSLVFAQEDIHQDATHSWCIWEGEEYLKEPTLAPGGFWMSEVLALHNEGQDVKESFEGVGSCRFLPKTLGPNLNSAISAYLDHGDQITPTRAYLKLENTSVKLVIPSAYYLAGTNLLTVAKDFYSLKIDTCHAQQQQVIDLGQISSGLRAEDRVIKQNKYGGVSVVLFEKSNSESMDYGLCHFHKINN